MQTLSITSKRWLSAPAGESYLRAVADGLPAGITSAGRTRAEQQDLWDKWRAGLMPDTPYVAKPGTSKHETGLALDLPAGTGARAWVHAHGEAYGWIGSLVPGEPWHFEYQEKRDTKKGWLEMATKDEVREAFVEALESRRGQDAITRAVWTPTVGKGANKRMLSEVLADIRNTVRGWVK